LLPLAVGVAAAVVALRRKQLLEAAAPATLGTHETAATEYQIAVQRQPADVYRTWRNLANAPRFMAFISSVAEDPDGCSHWVAQVPALGRVEWDAEITADRDSEHIAWQSVPGSPLRVRGRVRFTPLPHYRGTVVSLSLSFAAGPTGAGGPLAKALGFAVREDLRRFKRWVEAGEIPTVAGQPSGREPERRRESLRTAAFQERPRPARVVDPVDRASMDSFPASDPPQTR
jgi:uncharacterized membrane protein